MEKQELIKQWKNEEKLDSIGVYNITASNGLQVIGYDDDQENLFYTYFYYSEMEEKKVYHKPRKAKIYESERGLFFKSDNTRYYLHDFMRSDFY